MPKPTEPEKPTPKQERAVSPAILAARAFNRIEALIRKRDDELKNAPASIEGRYVRKIADARRGLSAEVAELLDGLLEKAGHTEATSPNGGGNG